GGPPDHRLFVPGCQIGNGNPGRYAPDVMTRSHIQRQCSISSSADPVYVNPVRIDIPLFDRKIYGLIDVIQSEFTATRFGGPIGSPKIGMDIVPVFFQSQWGQGIVLIVITSPGMQ